MSGGLNKAHNAALSHMSNILKEFYLAPVVAQLNQQSFLLRTGLLRTGVVSPQFSPQFSRNAKGIWVPRTPDYWEKHVGYVMEQLQWDELAAKVPVPVMEDSTIYKVIETYFLPVLAMHQITMMRSPHPHLIGVAECKLVCQRCGHVQRFDLAPPKAMTGQREAVEAYLRELVDAHFKPWEKVTCLPNGALRAIVAEWLTEKLAVSKVLGVADIKDLLAEEGSKWAAEFVVQVAEGMDLTVRQASLPNPGAVILRLPENHPYAKR